MTITEVLAELRTTAKIFEWELVGPKRLIRGSLKNAGATATFDPIAALCFIKTRQMFEKSPSVDAGTAIGLSETDSRDVQCAFDNQLRGPDDATVDPYRAWLRRQLLLAVGLKSVSNNTAPRVGILT
jgi:hypothetical protein